MKKHAEVISDKMKIWFILLLFLLLYVRELFALDITRKEIGFDYYGEYNLGFSYCQDFRVFAGLELNNQYTFKIGTALGTLGSVLEIKAFNSVSFSPLATRAFNLNMIYMYHGIPKYQMHSNVILPYLSYDDKWAGIAVGTIFRFTSFMDETPIFEPMYSYSMYVNFLNNERFLAGIKGANFNDFYAGNTALFLFSVYGTFFFDKRWALTNELGVFQNASAIFSGTFYGFSYRGGIRCSY